MRVTFSLDTVDKSSTSPVESPSSATLSSNSPLEDLMKINQQTGQSSRSGSGSGHGPTLAKEHSVQVVTSLGGYHHHQVVVEQSAGDSSSDEGEFVEAKDDFSDLSEDEKELILVLAGIGAWPSSSSSSSSSPSKSRRRKSLTVQERKDQDEMVMSSIQAVERGFKDLTSSHVKVMIVFLLLVYYAGHLSMALVA